MVNNKTSNLAEKIQRLKKEKNAIILSHYYQPPEVQDVADYIGDSLALAYHAAETKASIIVLAGVVFMAETAKVINPEKKVLVPDIEAGCSLADNCPAESFSEFIKKYPDHTKITYINCSAEVKALTDIVCTSSNAEKIIRSLPENEKILFAPDKNLGSYLKYKTGRDMVLWDGSCIVHEQFSEKKILSLKHQYPNSKIIAHPECAPIVIMIADFIGSTSALLNYAGTSDVDTFIVVTEAGILHQMKKQFPDKNFIPAPPDFYTNCNCGECPYMRMNSLQKVLTCLENESPEIIVDKAISEKAIKSIKKMFEITES